MSVTHIVLLELHPETTAAIREDVAKRVAGLKDQCLHPQTSRPYIVSMKAGVDISIEGAQNGISHAFVSVFETVKDRDYFVREDPAHMALVGEVKQYLAKVQVVDFVDGVMI